MRAQTRAPNAALQISVSIAEQELVLQLADGDSLRYAVSTAARGAGCLKGSYCTPTGLHRVRLKIGAGCPVGTVFSSRRPTGEVFTSELAAAHPDRDWILSRILWLEGLEPGVNRGASVDTLRRFVYIHGTADEQRIGQPASHGCIRMRNADVVALFEIVPQGALVHIA